MGNLLKNSGIHFGKIYQRNVSLIRIEIRVRTVVLLAILAAILAAAALGIGYYVGSLHQENHVMKEVIAPTREIQTGPRGGRFYINAKGNKVYVTPGKK